MKTIMSDTEKYKYSKAIIAGCFTAVAFIYTQPLFAWFCMVPLFVAVGKTDVVKFLKASFVYTLTLAICLFLWMPSEAAKFTGAGISYGLLAFFCSSVLFSLYYILPLACFKLLKIDSHKEVFINALMMAAIWVLAEVLFNQVFIGVPFFAFRLGHILAQNLYGIQYVSLLGVGMLSFVVVWVNYVLANFWVSKKINTAIIPLTFVISFYIGGYFIYTSFLNKDKALQNVTVATLRPNFSADVKWDATQGSMLIKELLRLQNKAIASGADIIVWTESVVPWTYSANDDFVKEIALASTVSGSINLLGIGTTIDGEDNLYNSVYGIMPNGKVIGRYDKQQLLSLIETPFLGYVIPFAYSSGFYLKKGPNHRPIGQAGILLCNEAAVPSLARNNVKNGAQYLVTMGNDGWIANTYLVRQHFTSARLRAVENRRDVVVNNENGVSALVRASGEVEMLQKDSNTTNSYMKAQLRNRTSFYTENSSLLMIFCLTIVIINTIIKINFFNLKQLIQ